MVSRNTFQLQGISHHNKTKTPYLRTSFPPFDLGRVVASADQIVQVNGVLVTKDLQHSVLGLKEALDLGQKALFARGTRLAALSLAALALLLSDDVRSATASVVHSALWLRDLSWTLDILRKTGIIWVVVLCHVALSTTASGVCVGLDRRSNEVFRLGVRSVGVGCDVAFVQSVAVLEELQNRMRRLEQAERKRPYLCRIRGTQVVGSVVLNSPAPPRP